MARAPKITSAMLGKHAAEKYGLPEEDAVKFFKKLNTELDRMISVGRVFAIPNLFKIDYNKCGKAARKFSNRANNLSSVEFNKRMF